MIRSLISPTLWPMTSQSNIDKKTIQKIADLAQLALTPEEENLYTEQLGSIVNYVSLLSEVNTDGIEPLVTPTDMAFTMREDEPLKQLSPEEIVANSPDKSGNLFKVPPVL